jgi:hypothetical protein
MRDKGETTAVVAETEEGGRLKHDYTRCQNCKFFARERQWCNYGDITRHSRLKTGGPLFPDGGCSLFSSDRISGETQERMRKNWANGKTDREAYAKAFAQERKETVHRKKPQVPKKRIPPETFVAVEALYRKGLTDEEAARQTGISRNSVWKWRTRRGLEANGKKK